MARTTDHKNLLGIIARHAGPPVRIENIIRELGVELEPKGNLNADITGEVALHKGAYRITVNANDHRNRKRFTMAHELGHFLYHFPFIGDGVDDDRKYRSSPHAGNFYNRNFGPEEEREAHLFAINLLLPDFTVRTEWDKMQHPLKLARLFQVSDLAMRLRLDSLGLLKQ